MIMTWRWFGEAQDSVTLNEIRQIPGEVGIVGALFDVPVGEVWPMDKITALKSQVEGANLKLEVIESVNIHEDIKLGLSSRDGYIENYIKTIRNLGKVGIKVICYNFMPVFDWTRSELAKELEDGSYVLSYKDEKVRNIDPRQMVKDMKNQSEGFSLPGWEPERLKELDRLFNMYENISEDQLRDNLKYFLEKVIPVAEEEDIKMAIHSDDPPWPIFGLPRIVKSKEDLVKICDMVESEYNALTLCSGSLGANKANNIPELIRYFGSRNRIAFGHVRNVKHGEGRDFDEASHLSRDGSLDMVEIMKAYKDVHYKGYIRPDHGRMIFGETARPGYGLYDRALGVAYLNGIWEAIN